MKTLTWTALVATAFVATAPLAHAGPGDGPGDGWGRGGHGGPGMAMRLMETYDTDKDGKVTQAEIDAVQAKRFATGAGANGQSLSIEQFETLYNAEHRERMVRAFQRLDRDGDGQVTREEFDRRSAGLVARMDRNGDGALSADDRPGRGERGERGHGRHGGWGKWFHGDRGPGPMGGPGEGGPDDGPDAGPDAGDDTP